MHFHPGFGRAAKGSAISLDALRNSTFNKVSDDGDNVKTEVGIELDSEGISDNSDVTSISSVGGDYGAHQAERLLDWSITHNLVPRGIFEHAEGTAPMEGEPNTSTISPNLTCVNIIETYLLPCAYGGIVGGSDSNLDQSMLLVDDQRHYATLSKHFTINASFIQAVVNATRTMSKMKQLQTRFPQQLSPDTLSIKAELNVWSKRSMLLGKDQNAPGGGILAGNIVEGHSNQVNPREMIKTLESGDVRADNTEELFKGEAYTAQGCINEMETILQQSEERYAATRDETIKPSVDWYNHVLGAWARSDLDGALDRTSQILKGMESFADNIVNAADESGRKCWVSPDTISYNSVLFCLARNPGKGSAKEAMELFHRMKTRYESTNDKHIRPDEVTYGSVLNALAQAGMAKEAENILDALEDEYNDYVDRSGLVNTEKLEDNGIVVPTLTIYNSVLNAWANSFELNAPRRAESLLERMKSLSSTGKNPSAEPDTVSLSTVISCHARSKSRQGAERAEELLDQAIAMYSWGNAKVRPDSIMFNSAVSGWANCSGMKVEGIASGAPIPAERAEMLLLKMKNMREENIHPVSQTFNIVLDSVSD